MRSKISHKILLFIILTSFSQQQLTAQAKYLSLLNYKIDNIYPINFKEYSISAHLQIQNDTAAFAMSNISGKIYKKDKYIASGVISDIYLENGKNNIYVKGIVTIRPNIVLYIITKISHRDLSKLYADASMRVIFTSGYKKHIHKQKVALEEILRD